MITTAKSIKARSLRIVLVAVAFFCLAPNMAWAGWGKRIADKVAMYVEYLEDLDETIASIMVDGLSKSSDTRSFTRYLYSGNKYTAVAIGDSRIADTDLVVYRKSGSSWIKVDSDADTENIAVVIFDCESSGEYKFEIKAYRFDSDYTNALFAFLLSF